MSLLMDALKRAEKARQAEAEKEAAGPGEPESSGLSLEAQPGDSRGNEPAFPGQAPPSKASAARSPASGLSLADDHPPAPPGSKTTGYMRPFSLMDDDVMPEAESAEMQSIAREAEEAVKKYFDDTGAIAMAGDEASAVGNDGGPAARGPTPDVVDRGTASAVFDAKHPSAGRRGYSAVLLLPVFLAVFLGVSGFLLWDDLIRLFVGDPPSLIVRHPPPAMANAPTPAPREATRVETAAGAAESRPAGTVAAVTEPPPPAPAPSTGEPGNAAGAPPENQKLAAAAEAASEEAASEEAGAVMRESAEPAASGQQSNDQSQGPASGPAPAAAPGPGSEEIAALTEPALNGVSGTDDLSAVPSLQISRKTPHDPTRETLGAAYEAFQRGENARARTLYDRVLSRDPRNRDALLGLGAVDTRSGNIDGARHTYARLLTLNPKDPVARAALIDSQRNVSPIEGEGHVKELLAQNSKQPFLYMTLGNLYARQQRWPEAQQAYFDAYRLDQENADYAFNLAVSLDRLGQRAAALSFYRRALDLAERRQASFDPQTVLKRISSLGMVETR